MSVRGAPAIAIAAGLSLAVELFHRDPFPTGPAAAEYANQRLAYLVTSRPTAVNLAELCSRLAAVAEGAAADGPAAVVAAVTAAAESEQARDVATNRAIGQHGAEALTAGRDGRPVAVLTHCNTGSLATAGYGTALGVVRALSERGALAEVFATETRPYNQGARLTAYELVTDGLQPATLIADSAASALMAAGRVHAVVVGADRVAANGDTANKIGTYMLAVAAKHHGVPFYVAAPRTTLDAGTPNGGAIVIEERPADEITHYKGFRVAADGIGIWNPGFDVTPAALISGIITEAGVLRRAASGVFDIAAACAAAQAPAKLLAPAAETPTGALDVAGVVRYCASQPALAKRLGGAASAPAWDVREIGDGNINFVFVVQGPAGALVLKQALPFIRMVGPGWPLPVDRIRCEAGALEAQRAACEQHVPEVYSWDESAALLAMRYVEPPHAILRGALVGGGVFPLLAQQMAEFLAATLFSTSALALGGVQFRAAAAAFVNAPMCALTEQVVFTDPFYGAPANRHTSPGLDEPAAAMRADLAARAAASRLKRLFMEQQQALLHGDLHTGSLMVTPASMFVIDSEFAFVGPMAVDVGSFLANLLLAAFASVGLEQQAGASRAAQRDWLLSCVAETWQEFEQRFCHRWDAVVAAGAGGEAALPALFGAPPACQRGAEALRDAKVALMREIFVDSISFAGCKMARDLAPEAVPSGTMPRNAEPTCPPPHRCAVCWEWRTLRTSSR